MTKLFVKLIIKLISWTSCSLAFWATSLNHKLIDDAMKKYIIIETMLGKGDEICYRVGSFVCMENKTNRSLIGVNDSLHEKQKAKIAGL